MRSRQSLLLRLLLVLGSAVALAACVLNADGFSAGSAAILDASTTEEAAAPELEAAAPLTEAAAPDASTAGGASPNLLVNGDFESGCANWSGPTAPDDPTAVTLTTSTEARTGSKSCRVCMNAASNTYVFQTVNHALTAGQAIFGEIYARGAQANPPSSAIYLTLNYTPVGQSDDDSSGAYVQASSAQWSRLSMAQDIYVDAPQMNIVMVLDGNQNKCVILDDASLSILP